jgi:ribosomal protein S18 acetylase RimI-like enzyme
VHVEFRQAVIPDELRALLAFDAKVFSKPDRFGVALWRRYESYWLLVNGRKVGCCALEPNADFTEEDEPAPRPGSLFIASTAVHPAHRGHGWGQLMKAWQVAYAQRNGFQRIVTNSRKSNEAMIRLNRKFGFKVIATAPAYYYDPEEAAVVMELRLS